MQNRGSSFHQYPIHNNLQFEFLNSVRSGIRFRPIQGSLRTVKHAFRIITNLLIAKHVFRTNPIEGLVCGLSTQQSSISVMSSGNISWPAKQGRRGFKPPFLISLTVSVDIKYNRRLFTVSSIMSRSLTKQVSIFITESVTRRL